MSEQDYAYAQEQNPDPRDLALNILSIFHSFVYTTWLKLISADGFRPYGQGFMYLQLHCQPWSNKISSLCFVDTSDIFPQHSQPKLL